MRGWVVYTAIAYPTKKDLALVFHRLRSSGYPLTGFTDHGVCYAIYLDDPDGNGVELYWDKPKNEWPKKRDGSLEMFTKRLDPSVLTNELYPMRLTAKESVLV